MLDGEIEKKLKKEPFYEHGQFMGQVPSAHNRAARIGMREAFKPDVRKEGEIKKETNKPRGNVVYPEEQGEE